MQWLHRYYEGYGFFLKNILPIPNVAEKNILILVEGKKKI
jgi:hypothetical protein